MTSLVEEYVGEQGQAQLLRSLKLTQLIGDSKVIAEEVAKRVELVTCKMGEVLIRQNAEDDDLHFILQGRLMIVVDDREVAIVNTGGHVGELALIDPRAFRCASAVAMRDTLTAKLSQPDFVEIANRHPSLWRRASQILGERLREFNHHVRPPNPRPRVFFACASRELGYALETQLRSDLFVVSPFLVENGDHGFATEHLQAALESADLGIIVRVPGDLVATASSAPASREIVFFLCGACTGQIGPARTIVVEPEDNEAGLFSRQFGIPHLTYRLDPVEQLNDGLRELAGQLRDIIARLGPK